MKIIDVELLDEITNETGMKVVVGKESDGIGVFLIREPLVAGAVWRVDITGVDFSDGESIINFLHERSGSGMRDEYDSFLAAVEAYESVEI